MDERYDCPLPPEPGAAGADEEARDLAGRIARRYLAALLEEERIAKATLPQLTSALAAVLDRYAPAGGGGGVVLLPPVAEGEEGETPWTNP